MKILLTGASGFLGGYLAEKLTRKKHQIRAMVRKTSDKSILEKLNNIELFTGDLRDKKSLQGCMDGIDAVIHAGATTQGSMEDFEKGTIDGTRYIMELAKDADLKLFLLVSSLVVYDINILGKNPLINEAFPLEKNPRLVGPYAYTKTESEKIAREYAEKYSIPLTVVRPGLIFGARRNLFFPHLGFAVAGGRLVIKIGWDTKVLPLTYIDNCCELMIKLLTHKPAIGKTFNIIDPQTITHSEYIRYWRRALRIKGFTVAIPFCFFKLLAFCFEQLNKLPKLKGKFGMSRYRLIPKFKKVRFDGSLILRELGWYPEIELEEALEKAFEIKK
ncbi:NAD(P)-dependent oxidoreductase [candidate division KSB1 bacterium]|nr:NAD(P)-dependent oxidoreductase [candidate division KSB1 bacterium]